MKKILFVTDLSFPGSAMASRLLAFVKLFKDLGYDIHLIAGKSEELESGKIYQGDGYSYEIVSSKRNARMMSYLGNENLIDAVADGDHSAIAAIIQKEIKAAVTAKEAEWMKTRPPINVGGGENTISKEQFNKMKYQERVEFKSKNPELYKKYTE